MNTKQFGIITSFIMIFAFFNPCFGAEEAPSRIKYAVDKDATYQDVKALVGQFARGIGESCKQYADNEVPIVWSLDETKYAIWISKARVLIKHTDTDTIIGVIQGPSNRFTSGGITFQESFGILDFACNDDLSLFVTVPVSRGRASVWRLQEESDKETE